MPTACDSQYRTETKSWAAIQRLSPKKMGRRGATDESLLHRWQLPRGRQNSRRLVDAPGIFGQIIPGRRPVGAAPGASADLVILANSALAFARGRIAKNTEEAAVAIDVHK